MPIFARPTRPFWLMLALLGLMGPDASRQWPALAAAHAFHLTGWEQDLDGYLASALVLATFAMQSMRRLRVTAITSNIAFISYATAAHLTPIFILHCILLPLNIYRLAQIERARVQSEAEQRV